MVIFMSSLNLRKIALQLGLLGLIFLYYRWHWQTTQNFVEAMDHCERLFCDFYKVFYRMGETIFSEKVPFKGFYYSPFAAILFHFWGRLPRAEALNYWGVTQALATAGLFLYWLPAQQKRNFSFSLLYLFLLFTAFPLLHNFKWGQVSIFLMLAVFLAMYSYQSNKWILSAFWLAFAVSIKFYPGIFLLYFIFKRDIKFLAAFGAFAFLFGIAIPAVFIGLEETAIFYIRIFSSAESRFILDGEGAGSLNSQYVSLVLSRLFGTDAGSAWFWVFQVAGFGILCANIVLSILAALSDLEHRLVWSFLVLSASIPFFVPTSWPHYFIYLAAFQAFAFCFIERDKLWMFKRILLLFSMVFSNILFFNFLDDRLIYVSTGFLFWSNLLLLLVAYMDLSPRVKFADAIKSIRGFWPRRSGAGSFQ